MSQLVIVTTPQNSGLGTPLATAFNYTNSNFSELYARYQTTPPTTLIGQEGDEPGMYAADSTYFYYCFGTYDGTTTIWAQITQVGNISLPEIQNGNSNVSINGSGSNVTIGVRGISNVVVVSNTRVNVAGAVSATGNVTGSYLFGNGSQLTGLPATYNNTNVAIFLGAFGSNSISTTGTITSGNITGANVFTGGEVSATGNITGNYILGNGSQLTGLPALYGNANVSAFLANYGSNTISSTGNVTSGNVLSSGLLSAVGNVNGGNITTLGDMYAQGDISALGNIVTSGYFVGTFFGNVTGNFVIPGSNTQVVFNTAGNADAVAGFTYNKDSNTLVVLGVVSSQGNTIAGNVNTTGLVTATGNVTGGNLLSNGQVSATGNISGANLSVTGAVLTNSLSATNSINATGNITGGNLFATGNAIISNLVQSTTLSATGNVQAGNVRTAGLMSATGNITGGNILTGGLISATSTVTSAANVVGGNITTAGQVTATGNVTGGNLVTAGRVIATGNVQGGNILTTANISASGNVTGSNFTVVSLAASGNVSASAHVGTTVSVTGNVTGDNIFATERVSATGNITGNYIFGNGSQLTGTYGNPNVAALLASFGSNTISTSGNISSGNLTTGAVSGTAFTGTSLSVSGNVTGASLIGTLATATQTAITSVGTLTSLSVTGNIVNPGATITTGTLSASGNVTGSNLIGTLATASQTAITSVGTLTSLSVTGNIVGGNLSVGTGTVSLGSIVNNNANGVGNIGSATTYFNTVFATATSAQYADLAENYESDAEYATGTVVVFGGEKEITVSSDSADERVAGVISENPAHLMNAGSPGLAVALRGRVPVRVIGPVNKGDSLVTSNIAGVAMSVGRSRDYAQAVFAKAIETNLDSGEKIVTAVIL